MDTILPYLTVTNFVAIIYLIILEGILSFDNALALAALVKSRLDNEEDQAKALKWGIWGAYVFRIGVIFAGVWLMKHDWIKGVAAAYLVYIGVKELFFHNDGEKNTKAATFMFLTPLWSTILAVELMDIMFSIDSIAVALSVSDKKPVLILGAVFGIAAMRYSAQIFIKLIDRFPLLTKAAFILVLMAGVKIIVELAHHRGWIGFEIPELLFMAAMFGVLGGSMYFSKPELKEG